MTIEKTGAKEVYSETKQFVLILFFMLALSAISTNTYAETEISKADVNNVKQVERGQIIYMRFCSLCHGKNLEGQANWHKPKPDGKMPAPPHDKTGHTWHHADIVLFNITKYGLVPPYAPEGYLNDMPGWEGTLKDEDIWAVLAFIKSQWPVENQEFQKKITKDYEPF